MDNWIQEYLNKLSPEDQKTFKEMLRDDKTFIVNSTDELIAALTQITSERKVN